MSSGGGGGAAEPRGPQTGGQRGGCGGTNGQSTSGSSPTQGGPECLIAGCIHSPTASSGVRSPGVSPQVDVYNTALQLNETDHRVGVRGTMILSFDRIYVNEKGYQRTDYHDATKPWSNNIGDGWTHSLNMHILASTGTPPTSIVFYDQSGFPRTYTYLGTAWGRDWYAVSNGQTVERGVIMVRDTTTLKFAYGEPGGLVYQFSAATTDANRYARLESIADAIGNAITLNYDGAVGTGKLTKVSGPAGDVQNLAFGYAGNLITKVYLRKNSTILQSTTYNYNASN